MTFGEYVDVANQVLVFSMFAVSLNLLMGYAGQVSIAHAAFGAVGGYGAAYLAINGNSFLLSLGAGMLAALLLGVVISLPALRLAREYLVLLTLAVQTIILIVVTSIEDFGGLYGILGIPNPSILGRDFRGPAEFFWLLLGTSVIVFAAAHLIGESPFGRVLRGIREDEVATRSLGKSVYAYKVTVFGITSMMAGLAGAMVVFYSNLASPGQFGFDQSMAIIAMVIVGGMGNLYGSVVGAAIVVGSDPLFEEVINLEPQRAALTRLAVYGIALVVILLWRPQGLLPEGTTPLRAITSGRRRLLSLLERHPGSADHGLSRTKPDEVPEDGILSPSRGVVQRPSAQHSAVPTTAGSEEADDADEMSRDIVQVTDLTKYFGGIHAVDHLNFTLARGAVTGLIGPNGAGKTTVFSLLTGAVRPDSGRITLNGADITGLYPNQVAKRGMVRSFQDVRIYPRLTVLDNVCLGVQGQSGENLARVLLAPWRVARGEQQTRELAVEQLRSVGLEDKAAQPAGGLAFGEQKLVALARILATGADVILLDEPASGIDTKWIDRMLESIAELRNRGISICVVEHNLHVVERVADGIYFMEQGRITAHGTMSELIKQERLREAYFGIV